MKDPLRYFIDEGFGKLFYWYIGEGKYLGQMGWTVEFKDFIPSFGKYNGGDALLLGRAIYPINSEFFHKYGMIVPDANGAKIAIDHFNDSWFEIKHAVSTIEFAPETQK